jgi:hypothetical protein
LTPPGGAYLNPNLRRSHGERMRISTSCPCRPLWVSRRQQLGHTAETHAYLLKLIVRGRFNLPLDCVGEVLGLGDEEGTKGSGIGHDAAGVGVWLAAPGVAPAALA